MTDMRTDEIYMRRCLELARMGRMYAAPNPMVGAVVVADGRVIGEGYHARCGQAHAEVNAIGSVRQPELLARSTLYVSLEPCAHFGRTPPCARLIIEKHIPRVVVGCQDPFPRVDGRGLQLLREAGIELRVGVLEAECIHLNRRFITFHTLHRPYVTLKWARSADGYIDRARTEGTAARLSTPRTLMEVHRLRAEHSAILVGTRTARLDDPALTVRHWSGPDPLRVVIDRRATLPPTLRLLSDGRPTLVLTDEDATPPAAVSPCVEYVPVPFGTNVVPALLRTLHGRGLQSLLVEGGAHTLQSFIDAGLWDEARVEVAPVTLSDGVAAPTLNDPHARLQSEQSLFGHTIRHYVREA